MEIAVSHLQVQRFFYEAADQRERSHIRSHNLLSHGENRKNHASLEKLCVPVPSLTERVSSKTGGISDQSCTCSGRHHKSKISLCNTTNNDWKTIFIFLNPTVTHFTTLSKFNLIFKSQFALTMICGEPRVREDTGDPRLLIHQGRLCHGEKRRHKQLLRWSLAIGINVKIDFVEIFKLNRETVFAKAVSNISLSEFYQFLFRW